MLARPRFADNRKQLRPHQKCSFSRTSYFSSQQERWPRSLGRSDECVDGRRGFEPRHRRCIQPQRRSSRGRALPPSKHSLDDLPSPRHRSRQHHQRPHRSATLPTRRTRARSRTRVGRSNTSPITLSPHHLVTLSPCHLPPCHLPPSTCHRSSKNPESSTVSATGVSFFSDGLSLTSMMAQSPSRGNTM